MDFKEILKKINEESNIKDIKIEFKNFSDYTINSEHYSGDIETIDYIKDKLSYEQYEGYLLGNAIKYLSRYNNKSEDINDIKKAITYLMWLVDSKDEKDM